VIAMVCLPSIAQNRWNIYAGGSISHNCEGYYNRISDDYNESGWGGGAFLGGGYEINFNNRWSITPRFGNAVP